MFYFFQLIFINFLHVNGVPVASVETSPEKIINLVTSLNKAP